MKLGMILWKELPLKVNCCPDDETPFSPVHKALKFSTVLGTVFPKSPKVTSPFTSPSIAIVNATYIFYMK